MKTSLLVLKAGSRNEHITVDEVLLFRVRHTEGWIICPWRLRGKKAQDTKFLQQFGILFHLCTCIVTTLVEKLFLSEVERYLCDHQVQYCYSYT